MELQNAVDLFLEAMRYKTELDRKYEDSLRYHQECFKTLIQRRKKADEAVLKAQETLNQAYTLSMAGG